MYILFLLGIYLGVKWLAHMVCLFLTLFVCLTFEEHQMLFPKPAVQFYFSTIICEGFNFPTFSHLFNFFIILIVVVKWHLVFLICIFLMANNDNNVELLSCTYWPFKYLLWKNGYSVTLPILKLYYIFVLLNNNSSLYFLDTSFLSDIWFAKYFNYSVGCVFTFFMLSFEAQKFLILMKFSLIIFSLVACIFVVLRYCCLVQDHGHLSAPLFSSKLLWF